MPLRERVAMWLQRRYSRGVMASGPGFERRYTWERLSMASKEKWLRDADELLILLGEDALSEETHR